MPVIERKGSQSSQGFGEFAKTGAANYIEDVFSTYLYTGTSATQTITNGIDLSTKGGLVWLKPRDGAFNHILTDTARGAPKFLSSNTTGAEVTVDTQALTAFTTTGFTLGTSSNVNYSPYLYASWTFRKQPKFFDIVTYTGNGVDGRAISHSLGSIPGFVIVKRTDTTGNWKTYHYLTGAIMNLNTTGSSTGAGDGYCGSVSSTTFTVYASTDTASITDVNASGGTYVAYLFAHNAGGFGLTGTDNVITCGTYTGNGVNVGPSISLGYEPQWLLYKNASTGAGWGIIDNMRGWATSTFYTDSDRVLRPNTANAEFADDLFSITSTGFDVVGTDPSNNYNGQTYIYIAIRRGPMKKPTDATKVFAPIAATPSAGSVATTNFPVDMSMMSDLTGASYVGVTNDRLRGYATSNTTGNYWNLFTTYTWSESTFNPGDPFVYGSDNNTGLRWGTNAAGKSDVLWAFRRAPGFFDVVCYTGTGAATTVSHNLGVAPELIIVKSRSNATLSWNVYAAPLGNTSSVRLNADLAAFGGYWNSTSPTASVFSLGSAQQVNENGSTFVAYLFASCPGVSKVGSYTGTGALQTINCGFTGGARFVLIKRTDTTGDWYAYDSARGISSGNDPYVFLNSTAAQVTGTNYVDTTSTGFQVTAAAPAGLNASGGTYIFLAIA